MKIKTKHKEQLQDAIDLINETINEIRDYIPEANIFFNGSSGVSMVIHTKKYGHSIRKQSEWQNSQVFSFGIEHADAGGY